MAAVIGALLDFLFGGTDDDADVLPLDQSYVPGHTPSLACMESGCGECCERWRVAIHEAGHVLAFDDLGEPWEFAEVCEDVDGAPAGGRVRPVTDNDVEALDPPGVYRHLVISHAGHAAECAVFRQFTESTGDVVLHDELMERCLDPDVDDQAWEHAESLILDDLASLEQTAQALFLDRVIYP